MANRNSFAVLSSFNDDDSDSEPKSVVALHPATVPVTVPTVTAIQSYLPWWRTDQKIQAMLAGKIHWGDLVYQKPASVAVVPKPQQKPKLFPIDPEAHINAFLSISSRIREVTSDFYDLSALSDFEYESAIQWLRRDGWYISQQSATWIQAEPTEIPCTIVPPPYFDAPREPVISALSNFEYDSATQKRRPMSPRKTPQFCKHGSSCTSEGCPFVHGDTIPRVDRPCMAGKDCQRRKTCIFMHPGDAKGSVIHRPTPTK